MLANDTEIIETDFPLGVDRMSESPLYCSSTTGRGKDNPTDPQTLTSLQKSRAVVVLIDNASEYFVIFHITGCCGTGRKYAEIHCACRWHVSHVVHVLTSS